MLVLINWSRVIGGQSSLQEVTSHVILGRLIVQYEFESPYATFQAFDYYIQRGHRTKVACWEMLCQKESTQTNTKGGETWLNMYPISNTCFGVMNDISMTTKWSQREKNLLISLEQSQQLRHVSNNHLPPPYITIKNTQRIFALTILITTTWSPINALGNGLNC